MPYWIGYKVSAEAKHIFLVSFRNLEGAKNEYDYLKKTDVPGEILTPPFVADTENEAREKVEGYIQDNSFFDI